MRRGAFRVGLATVIAIGLLGVTAAVSGAFASSAAVPPSADPSVPPPSADPFYAPPARLASYKPGTILRSRAVTAPGVDNYSAAYQLLYRTTDAKGQPIAAVTTLFLPSEPAPGPRHLFSFHQAYDSLSLNCAPSHTLRTGQVTGLGDASVSSDVKAFLEFGWDVAVPDYEGLDSQWGGRAAGGPRGAGRDPRGRALRPPPSSTARAPRSRWAATRAARSRRCGRRRWRSAMRRSSTSSPRRRAATFQT